MIFGREKPTGVLSEGELIDMAREIAEREPAYIIGSMLIRSVCDETGLDEGAAFATLTDGGGMPHGAAAISARAANDLIAQAALQQRKQLLEQQEGRDIFRLGQNAVRQP